ncbi:unnamed protein product [Nesidiocoris tenuis]|uniref:mRNA (guanine-N(7))-methyltransferase n=1 Tax=Nesidiocoris tenuis TaxID=355587 RepID=A0A6H5GTV7_9HEMI|nr:unnamed protein product [Nesidiocoris tenuis]
MAICCETSISKLKLKLKNKNKIFHLFTGEVSHVIGVDIADQSIADAQKRYSDMKAKNQRLFSAEFIVADVTRTSIRTLFKDPSMKVDLVSCQFSLHYSFESLGQAEKMMENMSASLKVGGLLIGTMPNAYDIVGRLKQSKTNWFGNSVFTIKFDEMPEPLPLFGAKYNFHLHEVSLLFLHGRRHPPCCSSLLFLFPMRVAPCRSRFLQVLLTHKCDFRPAFNTTDPHQK